MPQRSTARRIGRWLGVLGPDLSQPEGRSEDWQLDYLFSIGAVSWLIHLAVTLLTGVVLLDEAGGGWVPAWMAAMALLSLAMTMLSLGYRRRAAFEQASTFGILHSVLTALAGL